MNKLNNFQQCIITFAFLHNYIAFSGHDCTLYIIMVTFEHAMENPSAMEGHTAKILNLQEKLWEWCSKSWNVQKCNWDS